MYSSKKINTKVLSDLFRTNFLRKVASSNYSKHLSEVLNAYGDRKHFKNSKNLSSIFKKAYKLLSHNYKYEYIYKTTILRDIFLKNHDFDSAFYIAEFFCGNSRADIAVFNGYSTTYEIKTKYDTLNKLEKQLQDYKKAFNKIYVVADNSHINNIIKLADPKVGIIELKDNCKLKYVRQATSDTTHIDTNVVFDCLHKKEYKSIVHKIIGKELNVPNGIEYQVYKDIFVELSAEQALKEMIGQLHLRTLPTSNSLLFDKVPDCLHQAILEAKLTVSTARAIGKGIHTPLTI